MYTFLKPAAMIKKSEVGVRGGVRGYLKYQYCVEKNISIIATMNSQKQLQIEFLHTVS